MTYSVSPADRPSAPAPQDPPQYAKIWQQDTLEPASDGDGFIHPYILAPEFQDQDVFDRMNLNNYSAPEPSLSELSSALAGQSKHDEHGVCDDTEIHLDHQQIFVELGYSLTRLSDEHALLRVPDSKILQRRWLVLQARYSGLLPLRIEDVPGIVDSSTSIRGYPHRDLLLSPYLHDHLHAIQVIKALLRDCCCKKRHGDYAKEKQKADVLSQKMAQRIESIVDLFFPYELHTEIWRLKFQTLLDLRLDRASALSCANSIAQDTMGWSERNLIDLLDYPNNARHYQILFHLSESQMETEKRALSRCMNQYRWPLDTRGPQKMTTICLFPD